MSFVVIVFKPDYFVENGRGRVIVAACHIVSLPHKLESVKRFRTVGDEFFCLSVQNGFAVGVYPVFKAAFDVVNKIIVSIYGNIDAVRGVDPMNNSFDFNARIRSARPAVLDISAARL